jgi:type IV secretory pathway VirJ component
MKYFWSAQDDRGALASDVRAYAAALASASGSGGEAPVLLAGFSFGADLAPWVAGAGGWGARVKGLVLIGPDEEGSLEFRLLEMFGYRPKDHVFSVAGALKDASGVPAFFLHGEKDGDSAAPALASGAAEPRKITIVPGANHHFSGHEDELRTALIEGIDWLRRQKPAPSSAAPDPP